MIKLNSDAPSILLNPLTCDHPTTTSLKLDLLSTWKSLVWSIPSSAIIHFKLRLLYLLFTNRFEKLTSSSHVTTLMKFLHKFTSHLTFSYFTTNFHYYSTNSYNINYHVFIYTVTLQLETITRFISFIPCSSSFVPLHTLSSWWSLNIFN